MMISLITLIYLTKLKGNESKTILYIGYKSRDIPRNSRRSSLRCLRFLQPSNGREGEIRVERRTEAGEIRDKREGWSTQGSILESVSQALCTPSQQLDSHVASCTT